MRIAHLIPRMDVRGGAQVHVHDLATAQQAGAHDVCVFTGAISAAMEDALAEAGVRVELMSHLQRAIRPARDGRAVLQASRLLRRWRAELLHTHSAKGGVVGPLAARLAGVPAVHTAHGWSALALPGGGRPRTAAVQMAARAGTLACDRVITLSESDRALAINRRWAPAAKLVVIPMAIRRPPCPSSVDGDPPHVLSVTRFAWPKRPLDLVDALIALADLPWRASFVGDGDGRDDARRRVAHAGLLARVDFVGEVTDLRPYYREADLFVLTSDWEGAPLSLLEAMAAGLPCVTSAVGGLPEILEQGAAGCLLDRAGPEPLIGALRPLLVHAERRHKLGAAARAAFERRADFDHMVQTVDRLCLEVVRP